MCSEVATHFIVSLKSFSKVNKNTYPVNSQLMFITARFHILLTIFPRRYIRSLFFKEGAEQVLPLLVPLLVADDLSSAIVFSHCSR